MGRESLTLVQDLVPVGQLLWKPASFYGSLWGKISVLPQEDIQQQHNIQYLACQCDHFLFVCLALMSQL